MEWQTSGMEATRAASEVPAGFEGKNSLLDHYNTFYWTKRAWKQAPGDKTQAVLTHWTLKAYLVGAQMRLAMPHSIKRPLEGRTWFAYPGQGATSHELGWWKEPSLIGRRLDDGSSQLWENSYDTYGNVLTATDPLGRRTTYVYAANGADLLEVRQTTGVQDDLLAGFSNYTATHRPQTIVDGAGKTTTVTYNSAGQPLTVTNPRSEVTTLTYNTDGQLLTVDGPGSGDTTTYTYDAYGRVESVTNGEGYVIEKQYDLFDRVTRITYPDDTYDAFTYDKLDVATVRDRRGRITRVYHDALRRVVGVRDPLGRTVQQVWGPDSVLERSSRRRRGSTTRRVVSRAKCGPTAATPPTPTSRWPASCRR
jgi:YD repeat-containing protein